MRKFQIGKTYSMRSACDHNCLWSYKVTSRTPKTITVTDGKELHRFRVNAQTSELLGAEAVYPLGRYSMAPILTADHLDDAE